jgi:hypothetical protein
MLVLLCTAPALADGLRDAQSALVGADYAQAAALAEPLTHDPYLAPGEHAEAERIFGLALFFLGRRAESEDALLAYLKLEPDGHLDPSLYPPDSVIFFEDVRTRHAGEILIVKPRPPRKRFWYANLVPPLGQIQNRKSTRAWVIGAGEVLFLAANITTYALLRSSCDNQNLTCEHPETARALRGANVISGSLFIGTYLFGVVDGFIGYARGDTEPLPAVGFAPLPSGGGVVSYTTPF